MSTDPKLIGYYRSEKSAKAAATRAQKALLPARWIAVIEEIEGAFSSTCWKVVLEWAGEVQT
jgi:hypothetical protein